MTITAKMSRPKLIPAEQATQRQVVYLQDLTRQLGTTITARIPGLPGTSRGIIQWYVSRREASDLIAAMEDEIRERREA